MKKVLPYLGASLSALALAWSAPTMAQEPFKDVPQDHWAYNAIDDLQKKGILEGYPDGYFRGKRAFTRYEFAVALKRALDKVQAQKGDKGDPGAPGAPGAPGEPGPIGPPGMTPEEVTNLRNLTNDFKNELVMLGANIKDINNRLDGISKDIADIKDQLSKLPKVGIHAFFGVRTDRSRSTFADYGGAVRAASSSHFSNADVVHDVHIPISANLPGGLKLVVDPVISNYLSYRGGTLSELAAAGNAINTTTGASQLTEVGTLYKANLEIPIGGFGSNTSLVIGRYGMNLTKGTYYRPDLDPYFDVEDYDNGEFIQDGFKLESKFGSATTSLFAASFATPTTTSNGGFGFNGFNKPLIGAGYINQLTLPFNINTTGAQIAANQVGGIHAGIPLFKVGELGLTLATFSTNSSAGAYGNMVLYGANVKLNPLGRIMLNGEVAKTVLGQGLDNSGAGTTELSGNEDNLYYAGSIGYASGGLKVEAKYLHVDPRYGAPGYWEKIGNWYNPTNIKGPSIDIGYRVTNGLNLSIGGSYYTGVVQRGPTETFQGFLNSSDEIYRAKGGVSYVVNKKVSVGVDYEGVFYNLTGQTAGTVGRAKPIEQYITIGAGLNLAKDTMLKVGYQIISLTNNGLGFSTFGGGTGLGAGIGDGGSTSNASVFTTQLQVHF